MLNHLNNFPNYHSMNANDKIIITSAIFACFLSLG